MTENELSPRNLPKLTITEANEDSSEEEQNIPLWALLENIEESLKNQKEEETLYELFGKDLFHPPIEKIMQMPLHAARKFVQRTESADWSHMKNKQNQKTIAKAKLQKQWALKDFEIGRTLGTGRFATVYLVREKTTGVLVVLKVLHKQVLAKLEAERSIRSEIEIQAHLQHPNIVSIYGYFYDSERIYLVLDYAVHGDILSEVQLCRLDENTAANYISQLVRGIKYMHECKVLHRDLKLENIYLDHKGTIKIGDFGWAIHSHSLTGDKIVGTLPYMAPEMFTESTYDAKVDIWSLGIMAYQMLTGEQPFGKNVEEVENAVLNEELVFPGFLSPKCKDLLSQLLERNPAKRITIEKIQDHEWFQEQLGIPSLKKLCLNFIQEYHSFWNFDLSKLGENLRNEIGFDKVHHRYYDE